MKVGRDPSGHLTVSTGRAEPAWYLARQMPVSLESGYVQNLGVAAPPHPDPRRDFIQLNLLLPQPGDAPFPEMLPNGSSANAIFVPWVEDPSTPILVPAAAREDMALERELSVQVLVSPAELGIPIGHDSAASAAWRVLARAPIEDVVSTFAALAFVIEARGSPVDLIERLVADAGFPTGIELGILAEVRGGRPFLDPRCLRWIVRELAAAASAGVVPPAPGLVSLETEVIERVFLGSAGGQSVPDIPECLRAAWLLHESFYTPAADSGSALNLYANLTASNYGRRRLLSWTARIQRWHAIYGVDDAHPTVAGRLGNGHRPSDLLRVFEDEVGFSPRAWIAAAHAVIARQFLWASELPMQLGTLREYAEQCLPDPLDGRALSLIDERVVTDLAELGPRVIQETDREQADTGGYRGFGTTVRHEARSTRERPMLRRADGRLVPLGMDVLVERMLDVPRELVTELSGGASAKREISGVLGHMFEAYVSDVASELHEHNIVCAEEELARLVLRGQRKADVLIVNGGDQLFLEASLQTPSLAVIKGAAKSVARACARYQEKADQGESMLGQRHRIAAGLGLPRPNESTYLVVTDDPLRHSRLLAQVLVELRPDRCTRFVCSVDEFEDLVELGKRGYSVPRFVLGWQGRGLDIPLRQYMEENIGHFAGMPKPWGRVDTQRLLDDAPVVAA